MKANDLDTVFDAGEDISPYLDVSKTRRPQQEQKRVNVDFPLWMIQEFSGPFSQDNNLLSLRW